MNQTVESTDPEEIGRFAAVAQTWWNPNGAMGALHRLNPARLSFLKDSLARHFSRDVRDSAPFSSLRLLDIGCGAGLISEPMARLGFAVTGIDAAEATIEAARKHAVGSRLSIDYRVGSAEALAEQGDSFDAVLALEIVEHVSAHGQFLSAAAQLVRPGGMIIVSTFNRTARSFLLGIVAAEYILRWTPRGTHRWDRFLRPSELAVALRHNHMIITDLAGLSFDTIRQRWCISRDVSVNYIAAANKLV